jgi:hypothetical protein
MMARHLNQNDKADQLEAGLLKRCIVEAPSRCPVRPALLTAPESRETGPDSPDLQYNRNM